MKKYSKYIIIILLLVALDQGAKLIVAHIFDGDVVLASEIDNANKITANSDTFQIYPIINDSPVQKLLQKAEGSKISIGFLMLIDIIMNAIISALILLALYKIFRFLSKTKLKMSTKIINGLVYFSIASWAVRSIDKIFWDGTLDFLCISWKGTQWRVDHYHPMTYYRAFDITDIYLIICMLLGLLLLILIIINLLKLSKEERKDIDKEFKQRLKSFFKKVFRIRKDEKQG
ncbi:MAG: hypothetical protein A2Y17_01320 [Clostridiales bacterium GWF2_38_85]|nr:MAG: hypothetical protein A2Y17_01320 [Clostridiales bacterium GWF2_38_85]HBL85160.1 hypothetical protein [Clostridiales bacterium]